MEASDKITIDQKTSWNVKAFSQNITNYPQIVYPLSFLFGLLVWEVVASQLPDVVFASPSQVFVHLVKATLSGVLPKLFFAAVNLGEYMEDASAYFDAPAMLAVVFLLALFGLGAQEGIKWAEMKLLPWHVRD